MDPDIASRKIFIGGLSYGTDDEKLRQYFEAFGDVQDAVVMKDPVSRRSRGFGFITFESSTHVDNVLKQDVHTIDSRKVEAKRAVPRSEASRELSSTKSTNTTVPTSTSSASGSSSSSSTASHSRNFNATASPSARPQPSPATSSSSTSNHTSGSDDHAHCKIFVGGLHYDTRDGEFRNYFEKYGKVVSAEVMFNRETHKSRGFGFIVFETERGVDLVCAEKEHSIDGKLVEVKRAVPRSKIGGGNSTSSTTPSTSNHKQPSSSQASSSTSRSPRTSHKGAIPSKSEPAPRKVASTASGSYAAALKAGAGPSSITSESPTLSTGSLNNASPPFHPQQSPRQHSLSISSELDGGGSVHSGSVHSVGQSPVSHQSLPPMLPLAMPQQSFPVSLPTSQHQLNMLSSNHSIPTRPLRALSESFVGTGVGFAHPDDGGGVFNHTPLNQPIGTSFNFHHSSQQGLSFDSSSLSSTTEGFTNWSAESRDRSDMERSNSLSGLGWMPSSFSGERNSLRSGSGRELEVGLGLGLGLVMDHKDESGIGLAIPSHSDWTSLVDMTDNSHSRNDGSPHDRQGFQGNEVNNILDKSNCNDEASDLLQELRVQASEFQPTVSSEFYSNSGVDSGFPWAPSSNS